VTWLLIYGLDDVFFGGRGTGKLFLGGGGYHLFRTSYNVTANLYECRLKN
jgi:hypothetical protein